mmetsp:Transcript_37191/g.97771  ORF Transcript_37191/g.97771 Transcript_37191/m.97771 type:complete len:224 (-) Transcript_37191:308-979(-)
MLLREDLRGRLRAALLVPLVAFAAASGPTASLAFEIVAAALLVHFVHALHTWAQIRVAHTAKLAVGGALPQQPHQPVEAHIVEDAPKVVESVDRKELVAVGAHLREEAHLEVVDVVVRKACVQVARPVRPSVTAAKRRVGVKVEVLRRRRKVDRAVVLVGQQALGGAHLPLKVAARVVRHAPAEELEDAEARAIAVVVAHGVDAVVKAEERGRGPGQPAVRVA